MHRSRQQGFQQAPEVLQKTSQKPEFPPEQYYRSLPLDLQRPGRPRQRMEKRGSREDKVEREVIFKERDREKSWGAPPVRKDTLGKPAKEQERKRRKELIEETVAPRSPKQSRKHRKKERARERVLDADVVYEDWKPLYKVAPSRSSRPQTSEYELVSREDSRRRELARHMSAREAAPGPQRKKEQPYMFHQAGHRTVFGDERKEEERIYEEPEDLALYERHKARRTHELGLWIGSGRENKPKQRRNSIRPPPYVPPPAYSGQHRTFQVQRLIQTLRSEKIRGANLDSKDPPTAHPKDKYKEKKGDVPMLSDSQGQHMVHPNLMPSRNSGNDALEVNSLEEANKEEKTEKRKRFDPKTYKNLLGWKLPNAFGTWGGSSKRQEAVGEDSLLKEKTPHPPQVENVDDIYETIEVKRLPSKPGRKPQSISPSKPSSAVVGSGEGRTFCLVSNRSDEEVPTAKSYTSPRATGGPCQQDQYRGERPEEPEEIPREGGKQMPIWEREYGKVPEQKQHMPKKDRRLKNPLRDHEYISPYSLVKPSSQEGLWDKLPYECHYSYATYQPQQERKRRAFQELSSNRDLTEWRNHVMSKYGNDPRVQEQATFNYENRRFPSYSQTLPREKTTWPRSEKRVNVLDRRRFSLDRAATLSQEMLPLENSGERMSKYDLNLPRWTEPGSANTLPRQFEKDNQRPRIIYKTPEAGSYQSKRYLPIKHTSPPTEAVEVLPKNVHETSEKDNDGVFVIDATCVLIRAEYIFPPKTEQVKYLHPASVEARHGQPHAPDDKRDLHPECLNEPYLQGQRIHDNNFSVRSPCQKRILNKRPGYQLDEVRLETNDVKSCDLLGSVGLDRRDPRSASEPFEIQERASRILGLPVIDLEPLEDTRLANAETFQTNKTMCSEQNISLPSPAKYHSQNGVNSGQDESIRTLNGLSTCEVQASQPTEQTHHLDSSREPCYQQQTLIEECTLGELSNFPETEKTTQERGSMKSVRSFGLWGTVLNQAATGRQLIGRNGPDQRPVPKETFTECEHPQKPISEVCKEPHCTKEKRSRTPLEIPLIANAVVHGFVRDGSGRTQEHAYQQAPLFHEPGRPQADKEQRLSLEEKTWERAIGPQVKDDISGEDVRGQVPLKETIFPQSECPKAMQINNDEKEKDLGRYHKTYVNMHVPLVVSDCPQGMQQEYSKRVLGEDEHGRGLALQKSLPKSEISKVGLIGTAIDLPATHNYPGGATLVKPSSKRRGCYAKDLHEAVSRIRRHTAPDSDTDEELDHESPIDDKTPSRKVELLQKELQEKDALAYSSSDSNDSEATVIMRNSDEKDLTMKEEPRSCGKLTDAVDRWLFSSGQAQEAAALNPRHTMDPLEAEATAVTLNAEFQDVTECALTNKDGQIDKAKKPGSDLSTCIEEILQELNQAEIDFFGHPGENVSTSLKDTKHLAGSKTLPDS